VWFSFLIVRQLEELPMKTKPTYEELEQRVKELGKESAYFRRTEKALRKSDRRFRDFLESLGDVAYETDSSGNITYANKMSEIITGLPLKKIIGKPFLPLFLKESQGVAIDVYQRTLNGERPEYELTFINGKTCHFKNEPLRDKNGEIIGVFGIARDITERRHAEEELRKSEEKYRLLIDSSDHSITVFNRDGLLQLINIKGAKNLGATPEDLVGKSIYELFPDKADVLVERNLQIIESGVGNHFEDVFELPLGERWFWSNLQPVKDPHGQVRGVQIISYDITKRKKAEEAVRKAHDELERRVEQRTAELTKVNVELQKEIEERKRVEKALVMTKARLQHLLDVTPAVIYSCRPSGDYGATFISENIREQLGYEPHEFTDDPKFWSEHIHPDDSPRVFDRLSGILENGYHYHEYRFRNKDGHYRWMYDEMRLVRDAGGNPLEIVGYWIDVTKRKEAEERLRESEEKYRSILENMEEGYYEVDIAGNFTFFNNSMCKILGYSRNELMGMNNRQIMDQKNAKKTYETFNRVYTSKKFDKGTDWKIIRKDGTIRTVEVSISLMKDKEGLPMGFRGVARDITEEKLAEKALQEQAMRNDVILKTAMDGFCIHDLEGNILEANDAVSQIYGYSREEIIGRSIFDFDTRSPQEIWDVRDKILKNGYAHFETKHRCKDGRIIDTEVSVNHTPLGEGFMFCFLRDITQRKLSERALKEREKELEIRRRSVEEANIALKILLKRIEQDKTELEEKVFSNVKELIMPILAQIRASVLSDRQKAYLDVLESNLKDIISPFSHRFSSKYLGLTPVELQVANLVKQGKATKEIAHLSNLSHNTIEHHRKSIRKKLGINNKRENLRAYLISIQ
jgi:PAS domain S-box-containing protein